tara:strand:+ start:238 stop:522 length:285 start_codon:yes stop_codon:yes gene_type:complete
MKRLLILLAALSLPTVVLDNWHKDVYDERFPIFQQNYENGFKFSEAGDNEFACVSFDKANNELKNHLSKFHKYNSTDWFAIRASLKNILEACYD